jgi:hypothetical protein
VGVQSLAHAKSLARLTFGANFRYLKEKMYSFFACFLNTWKFRL